VSDIALDALRDRLHFSRNLPITPGAFQIVPSGDRDSFIAKIATLRGSLARGMEPH
jgi:hypothetical protein